MNQTTNNNRGESTSMQEIEIINHREFAGVLRVAGFAQADLARFIRKSRSHVNNVANGLTPITLRHMQELEQFLGSRLFTTALAIVRKQLAEAAQRRQVEHERQVEEQRRKYEETERVERLRREQRLRELEAELEGVDQGAGNNAGEVEGPTLTYDDSPHTADDQDDPTELNP
jgi:transcriptional regulator with XRE-family HTH domain